MNRAGKNQPAATIKSPGRGGNRAPFFLKF
jgi:hypothetical protein